MGGFSAATVGHGWIVGMGVALLWVGCSYGYPVVLKCIVTM
jgi:hypothetical protein